VIDILVKIGLVLFYIVLVASLLLNVVGLPGNWFVVVFALIATLIPPLDVSWTGFFIILGLAILGEIIEAVTGMIVVAGRGGTRWGVLGSFVGGLAGVVLGAGIYPPIGSVVLGFLGAFAGAVGGEYVNTREGGEALRIGGWAFVGRALSTMGKVMAGAGMIYVLITQTWR